MKTKNPLEGMSAEAKKLLLAQKMFDATKKKAAAEGVPFSLTVQDVYDLIPEKCPVLGTPFSVDEELLAISQAERRYS
jgi:hypothetical protein